MFNKLVRRLASACIPLMALAACGGGDTADRLDVADPAVRFVHAVPTGANVTLYRADVAQSDATDVGYPFASNYFDVPMGTADWAVKTTIGNIGLGTVNIDPQRGTKYTVVAYATSLAPAVALIIDPYNKSLASDNVRVRLFNGAFTVPNVDLYISAVGASITNANPNIAATASGNAGPASGNDSAEVEGGTYQLTVTAAGSKIPLFQGNLAVAANKDLLLIAEPDNTVGGVKLLSKIEGDAGANDVPPL